MGREGFQDWLWVRSFPKGPVQVQIDLGDTTGLAQSITALWVCYMIPDLAENSAQWLLEDLWPHISQLWDMVTAPILS